VKSRATGTYLLLVIMLLMLPVMWGCTETSKEPEPVQSNPEQLQSEEPKTIQVTDSFGRIVEVPDKVDRIATLYAFTGHVTTLLGKGDLIIAVNRGLKRDILFNRINPVIADSVMPVASDKVNIEELLKAEPDLVFVQGSVFRDEREREKLDKSKIPYLAVEFNSIEGQIYAIDMIGQALGVSDTASRYLDYYRGVIELVRERVEDIPENEKLRVYHSVNEATRTYDRDNLAADWTVLAGVINVSLGQELRFLDNNYFASLEQILLWDPDLIIVNEDGVADYILTNKQWSPLKAVKSGQIHQMPVGVSRWGHPGSLETPLGILFASKLFYPERFTDIDMRLETRKFYGDFFEYDLSNDELESMLSGKGMRDAK
jgi:iron complex transport system substrate-binding protein